MESSVDLNQNRRLKTSFSIDNLLAKPIVKNDLNKYQQLPHHHQLEIPQHNLLLENVGVGVDCNNKKHFATPDSSSSCGGEDIMDTCSEVASEESNG